MYLSDLNFWPSYTNIPTPRLVSNEGDLPRGIGAQTRPMWTFLCQETMMRYLCKFFGCRVKFTYAANYFNDVKSQDLIKNEYLIIKERKQPLPFVTVIIKMISYFQKWGLINHKKISYFGTAFFTDKSTALTVFTVVCFFLTQAWHMSHEKPKNLLPFMSPVSQYFILKQQWLFWRS